MPNWITNLRCPVCGSGRRCSIGGKAKDGRVFVICRTEDADHDGAKAKEDGGGEPYWVHLCAADEVERVAGWSSDGDEDEQRLPRAASASELHQVYTDLLTGTYLDPQQEGRVRYRRLCSYWEPTTAQSEPALGLSPDHRASLLARGLDEAAIRRNCYATAAPNLRLPVLYWLHCSYKHNNVPGLVPDRTPGAGGNPWWLHCIPGLLVPVRDELGQVVALQVRADQPIDGRRYLWVSSASAGGASPGAPCHVPLWDGPTDEVWITEGPLKADVATHLLRRLVVGVPGVGQIEGGIERLKAIGPKVVVMAYDRDANQKVPVARAQQKLLQRLREEGFRVKLQTWDPGPNLERKGVDDWALTLRRQGLDGKRTAT